MPELETPLRSRRRSCPGRKPWASRTPRPGGPCPGPRRAPWREH